MLKPSGILIASFLTPHLTLSKKSTWTNVNTVNALKQKAIFAILLTLHSKFFVQKPKHVHS
ncbi:hypothetical protein MC5_06265 [Rickettsia australis str. Cutlack]|uniref:Uncharacterized protein n=1 Tax=Rickettsia australis (strain Cutlack) TaxID=1105110 RepID=H8K8A6_RICAC|nr:hypothetical protein MC5_06265 [Rickettsia australis str. Cutlack]